MLHNKTRSAKIFFYSYEFGVQLTEESELLSVTGIMRDGHENFAHQSHFTFHPAALQLSHSI